MTPAIVPAGVPARQETTVLEVIRELATDDRVSVEKLAGLMALQERAEARNAEREFNIDLAAAMSEMPNIRKDACKDMGAKGSIPYASYEQLDKIIRPIEKAHGFCRIFTTAALDKPGTLMTCRLLHRGGHAIESTRYQPPDPGPGRNDTQAIGSADSYARRYLTLALWNLVTVGADDDGKRAGAITTDQADTLRALVSEIGLSKQGLDRLLALAQVSSLDDVQRGTQHDAVMQALLDKRRQKAGAK